MQIKKTKGPLNMIYVMFINETDFKGFINSVQNVINMAIMSALLNRVDVRIMN